MAFGGHFERSGTFMAWCAKGRMVAQIGRHIAVHPLHQQCIEYVSQGEH